MIIQLNVNGRKYEPQVEPWHTLLHVLRENLGLTGAKKGCDSGQCSACTVLLDGIPILSCTTLAVTCQGKEITTIEGLAKGEQLHPLQQAFIDYYAVQCGFCTPGMILHAKALLDENPNPSEEEVREAISSNLCRCTGYVKPVEAILAAADTLRKGGQNE
jgi:aerobic-type carbon monoxide dehydrogenase small subunit (CoxS/CutS family)